MSSSRVRHLLVAMIAVFAFSAVAAASASAHAFFVKGVEVKAEEKFETTGTSSSPIQSPAKLQSIVGGVKVVIECESDVFKDTIEKEGKTTATVKWGGCTVWEIKAGKKTHLTTCKVTEPIEAKNLKDKLITGPGGVVEEEFEPETSGGTFTTIEITGCALEGKYKVTGIQVCSLPNGEIEGYAHEIVCTPTGSKLKFGAESAAFTDNLADKLVKEEVWRAE